MDLRPPLRLADLPALEILAARVLDIPLRFRASYFSLFLIDFPAIIGGREVFLCWEQDEDDIEFWHDIDAGYAGRERL